jgi:hypothetical protein
MNDIDLTPLLKKSFNARSRTRGRYNSSEIYALLAGWTTPEQWMHAPDKTVAEMLNMWSGTVIHKQIQELLQRDYKEEKQTLEYRGMTLVGKADWLPPGIDEVHEFKTSEVEMKKGKPWAEHQTKLFCTLFKKSKGLIFQPVTHKDGLFLKHISTVERDDEWVKGELDKLYEFHMRLEQLWDKTMA